MTNHKNVKNNKRLGKGEECKTSLFKPLVATSLALALGVSVASADACVNTNGTTTPIFCTTTNGTLQSPLNLSGVNWNGSNGGGNTSFWTLGANGGTTPVNITLQFNTSASNGLNSANDTYIISQNGQIGSNANSPILQLSSTTRGIDMQGKTLTFDFLPSDQSSNTSWNSSDGANKRKMILNLSGTTQNTSLKGDILIKAGLGAQGTATGPYAPDTGIIDTNVFEATLGGDMIGNITISPYDNSEKLMGKDIKTTFTFNSGSLTGNITSHAGTNTFNFNGTNAGITGDVFADNNYQKGWTGQGTENGFYGGVNTITFSGSGTHTITGSVTAQEWGQNNIFFNAGVGTILGSIISGDKLWTNNVNHNNTIVFKGTSATIGSDSKTSSIIVNDDRYSIGGPTGKYSYNVVEFNAASSNTLKINELKIIADLAFCTTPTNKTLNVLSFNNTTATNTASINVISASNGGRNIIGTNLYQSDNTSFQNTKGFNSALFESFTETAYGSKKVPAIQVKSDFETNFMTDDYILKGSLSVGSTPNTTALSAGGGNNYINVDTLTITGNISANNGVNSIRSKTATLDSVALWASGSASNNLTIDTLTSGSTIKSLSLEGLSNSTNSVTIKNSDLVITNGISTNGVWDSTKKNIIILEKANATLTINAGGITTQKSNYQWTRQNTQYNNITFKNGGSLILSTGDISTQHGNQNNITFEGSNGSTLTLSNGGILANSGTNTITSVNALNIIGKISTLGSGVNNITANGGNSTILGISTKDYDGTGGNTLNLGSATLTINARSGDDDEEINGKAIYAKNGGNTNTISAQTIHINADVYANSSAINSISGANIDATSNILKSGGGQNNFTFTADSGTLTLKGQTNQITTLTAFSGATTNGNTLIIDGSLNANATTIDKVADSYLITANFVGQNASTLKILGHFSGSKNITLKAIALGNSAKNNTLDLTALTQTTIANAISVGANQDLAIKVGNSSTLILTGGMTTAQQATSAINATGNANQVTTTIKGDSAISASKFEVSSALSVSNLTFDKNTASSPITFSFDSFVSSATQNNINLNAGVSSLTLGTTSNSISAENPVGFGTISYLGSSAQSLAINGGTNTISTLTISGTQSNTLSIGGGSTSVGNAITASNIFAINVGSTNGDATLSFANSLKANGSGATNVTFKTTSNGYTSTLSLGGADNYISSVTTEANANGVLEATAGTTTIAGAINMSANQNLTLALTSSSDRLNPSETSVTLNNIITKGSGVANVTFTGGTDNQHYYSTLTLAQANNTLNSVTSNAKNARITMQGTAGATIDTTTIGSNSSLVFGFTGSGASTVTSTQGIYVGSNATLGVSIGGSGEKKLLAGSGKTITFDTGSTLLVDFLSGSDAQVTLGNNEPIIIGPNRKSIINFHGASTSTLNGSGITLQGGTNTINFLGSAEIGSRLTLTSGTNTINVYAPKSGTTPITATIVTNQIGSVSNIINLDDYAILDLKSDSGADSGSGTLTSSGLANTLNFKGNEATFKGGFGANESGSATINVGSTDKEIVSGTITGAISNASLNFNAGKSILTLQSQTNTFTTINSQAKDGVLVLDTSATGGNGAVNATISGATTIASGKSLSFDFQGDNASTITTTGGLVIDGTLGVIINGNGNKAITGNINLNGKGTLLVDYASGNGSATLGNGNGITIRSGESSIINFNGGSGTLANALTLNGGSNTINFNVNNAKLEKISLVSGTNTINIKDDDTGLTATIENLSSVGGVKNIVNLGKNATLKLGTNGGESLISSNASKPSTLNFNGDGAKLQGSFGASGNGSASVNVAGSNSVITGNLSNASITFSSDTADLTLQSGNSTITSLTGYTAPSTYTRNGRTITQTISNTLTLDNTGSDSVSATITSAVVGDSVGLKFGDGSESKTFTFSASGNHLTGVVFGTTSTNNTLEFTNGNSTLDSVTLASGSDLTIKLGDASLTLTGGYAKGNGTSANLSVTGNASVSGGAISANALTFANNTSLSVSNSGANTFASVDASNAGTLIANDSALTITALSGNKLTAGFSGNNASSIAINGANGGAKTITLVDVVLNNNAKGTLDLSSLTSTTITNNVSVGANQSLAINLGGTSSTLTFTGGLSGNATINAGATSNTIAGSSIALSNLNLSGTDNTTTLTTNSATINTLNANATTSNKLVLDATNNTNGVSASINSIGSTTRSAGSLDIALISSGSNTTTLSLNGNTINSLDIQGDKNTLVGNAKITSLASANGGSLNINGGNVEVTNAIEPTSSHNMSLALNSGAKLSAVAGLNSGTDQINLTLNNSTLSLGADSTITSLSGNGGVIDFVSSGKDTSKKLTLSGNCDANANVITYVSGNQANIVEASNDTGSGTLTISAVGSADEIFSITYENGGSNNVKVAQIGSSGTDKAVGGTSDIEGEIIQISLSTDGVGGYYIGSAISKGVDTSVQEVVTSALAVNYDLYLANFNSLNKRMGELRNTQESNGVWARVFGGAMSNDFGVGSKTDYITTQAGYDYSLSVGENARNFIGVAIAYGASSTKSNPSSNPNTGVLDNISSSMVEVGLYNSYVADSGWYNDTIFKFDYIMSDFTLKTGSNSQQNSTSNFAMILSDEFGYRYSFGENEKGSWYIDPQAEFAFGYFNQSDFNQALNESATRTIKATQDSILTLRSRVGASLGKKFNTDKGFASLYVGAFYEYDYIEGGKSDYSLISSSQEVSNPLQSLESNGRAILNVGSNIELTKGARLYIDVEKSFGDKQRTFMQFNLGARYSF